MDTETLKTFILLAKSKNFSRTAEQLFVAQSTVTNRIADLERELGKTLFIRNNRKVALTDEGMIFEQYAERMLKLEEAAFEEIHSIRRYSSYTHIGTTNTIYECHLYSKIKQILKENPDDSLKITIGHSQDLLRDLQDGIIDIVFCYTPLIKKGFTCKVFAVDELILVTAMHKNDYHNGINKEDLLNSDYLFCNFALQEVGSFIRELFPPHYKFRFEIDNSTKLIPYLLDIGGISFLPESLAKPYLDKGELVKIPLLDFTAPKISCYMVQKESERAKVKSYFKL